MLRADKGRICLEIAIVVCEKFISILKVVVKEVAFILIKKGKCYFFLNWYLVSLFQRVGLNSI